MEFLVSVFSNNMIQRDEKKWLNQFIGTVCFILRFFIVANCCAVIYFLVPVTKMAITMCYNNQYYDFKTGEVKTFYSLFCLVFCWIGWFYVIYLYYIWIPQAYRAIKKYGLPATIGRCVYAALGYIFNTSFNFPIDSNDQIEFYPSKLKTDWWIFLRTVDCNCCK